MFELDYSNYVAIDEGIFWVGYQDSKLGLHSNPYLIVEGDEAVLIDGGSRPDFSTVMLKIMQVGIKPDMIKALIYHHYDPDLCGSISHFEKIIDDKDKIKGSRHFKPSRAKAKNVNLRKDLSVYLYCENGKSSKKVARKLSRNGFKNLYVLSEGYANYKANN